MIEASRQMRWTYAKWMHSPRFRSSIIKSLVTSIVNYTAHRVPIYTCDNYHNTLCQVDHIYDNTRACVRATRSRFVLPKLKPRFHPLEISRKLPLHFATEREDMYVARVVKGWAPRLRGFTSSPCKSRLAPGGIIVGVNKPATSTGPCLCSFMRGRT